MSKTNHRRPISLRIAPECWQWLMEHRGTHGTIQAILEPVVDKWIRNQMKKTTKPAASSHVSSGHDGETVERPVICADRNTR